MSTTPKHGKTIGRVLAVALRLVLSRHGLTREDLASTPDPGGGDIGYKTAEHYLRQLTRMGWLTRELEGRHVWVDSRYGRRRSTVYEYRYRLHPDLLRRLHETWGPTFEAMSAEIANDRRRVG